MQSSTAAEPLSMEARGVARLAPGSGDRALIEFDWTTPASSRPSTPNLVVTMADGRIASMTDVQRATHRTPQSGSLTSQTAAFSAPRNCSIVGDPARPAGI